MERTRSCTTPSATTTRPTVIMRSLATPPDTTTQSTVLMRSTATPTASATRRTVLRRYLLTPPAITTRRTVLMRSVPTPTATTTRRTVLTRSNPTPPATSTLLSVMKRSKTTPLASAISPWVLWPDIMSPRPLMLSVSAQLVRTWTTVAISATYTIKPLPEELPFTLIHTANLARSPPPGGLKRKLSQWNRRAKRFSRSNQSRSDIRKGSIRKAFPSLAWWPRRWKR